MTNLTNRSLAATGAVVATLITFATTAIPARAESVGASVSYAGLDLSNAKDAATFDGRVRQAASTVCGEQTPANRFPVAYCRTKALSAARHDVARIAAPQVASR